METIIKILQSETYLFALFAVFIITGIIKHKGYFVNFYQTINKLFNNKKATLAILSAVGGVLPVEGRNVVSAPFLDSMVKDHHYGRPKMGIINYVATHHYYLWSPLEPSVMIFITALGISWFEFMQATIIPLGIYMLFLIYLLMFYIKDDDIVFEIQPAKNGKAAVGVLSLILTGLGLMVYNNEFFTIQYVFPAIAGILLLWTKTKIREALSYVNWNLILIVGGLIALGVLGKEHFNEIKQIVQSTHSLPIILGLGAIAAFIMGSSSKYAGLGAAMLLITNVKFLPLVIAVEYVGYLLSPTHKCLGISKMFFDTDVVDLYKYLLMLSIGILTGAGVTYSLFYI